MPAPSQSEKKQSCFSGKFPAADAYLFDIDGTLLNSRDAVHYNAFCKILSEVYGVDSRLDNIPVHGNTDIGILRAAVEYAGKSDIFEARLPQALEKICAEAQRNIAEFNPELCPSIRELIQLLSSQNKILGVATGNLEMIGWAKIEAAGLRKYFSFGSFCENRDGRESRSEIFRHGVEQARVLANEAGIESPKACVIGDTPADIHAARANGISVIAVATGIFNYEELKNLNPDLCLRCCSDLFLASSKILATPARVQ